MSTLNQSALGVEDARPESRLESRLADKRKGARGEVPVSSIGQPERATQDRVIALCRDELRYRYLGDWTDRAGNSNVEEDIRY